MLANLIGSRRNLFNNEIKNVKMKIAKNLLAAYILMNVAACQKSLTSNESSLSVRNDGEGPTVTIVSPSFAAKVARGEGRKGVGSFNGTNFLLDVKIVTHDEINVVAKEGLNIRNTALLGN